MSRCADAGFRVWVLGLPGLEVLGFHGLTVLIVREDRAWRIGQGTAGRASRVLGNGGGFEG